MKGRTAATFGAMLVALLVVGARTSSAAVMKLGDTVSSQVGPMWFYLIDGPGNEGFGESWEIPVTLTTVLQFQNGDDNQLESQFLSYRVDVPGGVYSYDFDITNEGVTNHFAVEFTTTDSFIEFGQRQFRRAFVQSNGDIVVNREIVLKRLEAPQVEWTLRHIESGESRTGKALGPPLSHPDEFTIYQNRLTEVVLSDDTMLPVSAVMRHPELGATYSYYENWFAEFGGGDFTLLSVGYGGFPDFEPLQLSLVPEPSSLKLALVVFAIATGLVVRHRVFKPARPS